MIYEELSHYLPSRTLSALNALPEEVKNGLTEIRLLSDCPELILSCGKLSFLGLRGLAEKAENALILFPSEAKEILGRISNSSLYAFEDTVRQGYLTLRGGHRVGLAGRAVTEHGKVVSLCDIRGFCFRLARPVIGCSEKLIPFLIEDGAVKNTILVSSPGQGKTTLLRDMARALSARMFRVCVVDERLELGLSDPETLPMCFVLEGFPRAEGIETAIRSLSPQIVVTDEVSSEKELLAIRKGMGAGVRFLLSAHGNSAEELAKRPGFRGLLSGVDCEIRISSKNGHYRYEARNCIQEDGVCRCETSPFCSVDFSAFSTGRPVPSALSDTPRLFGRPNGSFSAFGKESEPCGKTFLT